MRVDDCLNGWMSGLHSAEGVNECIAEGFVNE